MEDAERLLIRLNDPTNPTGLPAVLRVAPPLSPLQQLPAINPTQNPPTQGYSAQTRLALRSLAHEHQGTMNALQNHV